MLRRARERKQQYIIIYGYRQRDVRDLGYTWFDEAVLEQQFGDIAIFRVPRAPTPTAPAAVTPAAAPPASTPPSVPPAAVPPAGAP